MSVNYLSETINDILSIARLAPSVHNSQPWKVSLDGEKLDIALNRKRLLRHGDPTGRQSFISLGIFTEACLLAVNSIGLTAGQPKIEPDGVMLRITGKSAKHDGTEDDVAALRNRFTDRSVYKKVSVTEENKAVLNSSWNSDSVHVLCVSDQAVIEQCARLTKQALLLAFSNPDFRRELTDYFTNSAATPYGIPIPTLGAGRAKQLFVKRLINSGVSRRREAQIEYKRWLSASALVFILAGGDSKPYWLESGRAYLRASLEIQKLGFRQATSAAIVEAVDFHEDIEKLLGTKMRIQSVIRIGRGVSKKKPSGRFSPQELLAT